MPQVAYSLIRYSDPHQRKGHSNLIMGNIDRLGFRLARPPPASGRLARA